MKNWRLGWVKTAVLISGISGAVLAAGCVALLAPVVGGVIPSYNKVTIDKSTFSPELKQSFLKAKRLTLVSSSKNKVDIYMADYLDKYGGYETDIRTPPGPTTYQVDTFVTKICSQKDRPDLVLFGNVDNSPNPSGGANFLEEWSIGRVGVKFSDKINVIRCRDNWKSQFLAHVHINSSVLSSNKAKLNKILGKKLAKALLQVIGKEAGVTPRNATSASN